MVTVLLQPFSTATVPPLQRPSPRLAKGLDIQPASVTLTWDGNVFRIASCELSIDSRNVINLKTHLKDSQDRAGP